MGGLRRVPEWLGETGLELCLRVFDSAKGRCGERDAAAGRVETRRDETRLEGTSSKTIQMMR
jgi:hypothetical protein